MDNKKKVNGQGVKNVETSASNQTVCYFF